MTKLKQPTYKLQVRIEGVTEAGGSRIHSFQLKQIGPET